MSEQPKPKSYLLMVGESIIPFLNAVVPGLQYIEVQAVNVKDSTDYVLLGNPVPKPQPEVESPVPLKEEELKVAPEANGN